MEPGSANVTGMWCWELSIQEKPRSSGNCGTSGWEGCLHVKQALPLNSCPGHSIFSFGEAISIFLSLLLRRGTLFLCAVNIYTYIPRFILHNRRAEETARWAKCLPHKREDLSAIPRSHGKSPKNPGAVRHSCNPSSGRTGREHRFREPCWPASVA